MFAAGGRRTVRSTDKEVPPVHYADGLDWLWMSFMMVFWVALIGVAVYVAVRLAQRPPREGKS